MSPDLDIYIDVWNMCKVAGPVPRIEESKEPYYSSSAHTFRTKLAHQVFVATFRPRGGASPSLKVTWKRATST